MKDRKRKPDSRKNIVFNIQSIILSVLMAISLVTIIVMGLLLYHRFKLALEKTAVDNTEATVEATVDRLNADLLDIRQIINGANYNVVQQFDISSRSRGTRQPARRKGLWKGLPHSASLEHGGE